jgi:hypothetical protein
LQPPDPPTRRDSGLRMICGSHCWDATVTGASPRRVSF